MGSVSWPELAIELNSNVEFNFTCFFPSLQRLGQNFELLYSLSLCGTQGGI